MDIEQDQTMNLCKSCGFSGAETYCARCGQAYNVKRITMQSLLHDIFHLFTHLDKGFGYTLKMLATAPGLMQRDYVEGNRARHQKPFSMFLICATVTALIKYWSFQILIKYYQVGDATEANFFQEYMVIFFIVLLPLHAYLVYLFFYKSGYNLAEIVVFFLYSVAFFFLVAIIISMLRFIWPNLDTAYIEFPFLVIYNAITFMNFFRSQPRWVVALKSVVIITLIFFSIQVCEDLVIKSLK